MYFVLWENVKAQSEHWYYVLNWLIFGEKKYIAKKSCKSTNLLNESVVAKNLLRDPDEYHGALRLRYDRDRGTFRDWVGRLHRPWADTVCYSIGWLRHHRTLRARPQTYLGFSPINSRRRWRLPSIAITGSTYIVNDSFYLRTGQSYEPLIGICLYVRKIYLPGALRG